MQLGDFAAVADADARDFREPPPQLERLEEIATSSGLPIERLHDAIHGLEQDPEAYWVSAEAHERWRGRLPYQHYPMRRIASIGLLSRRAQSDAMFPQR